MIWRQISLKEKKGERNATKRPNKYKLYRSLVVLFTVFESTVSEIKKSVEFASELFQVFIYFECKLKFLFLSDVFHTTSNWFLNIENNVNF